MVFFPAPFYLAFALSLAVFVMLFVSQSYGANVYLKEGDLLFFIAIFSYFGVLKFYDSSPQVWLYYTLAFCSFYLTLIFSKSVSEEFLIFGIKLLILFTFLMLSFDTVMRFMNPNSEYLMAVLEKGESYNWFYAYKHSYIFQDSNFVGLVILVQFFLLIQIKAFYKNKLFWMQIFGLLFLLFMTFSRACILSVFLGVIGLFFFKLQRRVRVFFYPALLLALVCFVAVFSFKMGDFDQSLDSKFYIISKFYYQIQSFSLSELLFGWGFDNTRLYWGIAAHNLVATLLLETGVIGFVLVFLFFIYYGRYSLVTGIQIFSFAIASLSFGFLSSAYLVPIALSVFLGRCKVD